METELLNIRIPPEDMQELKKHADSLGLSPRILGRFFIAASIKAVNGAGQLTLPVNFKVQRELAPRGGYVLNEPKKSRK